MALGCGPAPCGLQYGYDIVGGDTVYAIDTTRATPDGIRYDGSVDTALLDQKTAEVEQCLGYSIPRDFVVKIPDDWSTACVDPEQQVLNSYAPESGCDAKGLVSDCPCRWRALVQCPNVIVTTPNLALYKDALVRYVTGSSNPWANPDLVRCL